MTAPLAWIYAIPVEHFMPEGAAVRANLWLLAIVSTWRVLLITRGSSVLFGASFDSAFVLVMLFADTLALFILFYTPLPVINIMGGIEHTAAETAITNAALAVEVLGVVTLPIWLIGAFVVVVRTKRNWMPLRFSSDDSKPVAGSLWLLGACAVVVWLIVLPYTQPAQSLRRKVEDDLQNGRIGRAIDTMSNHEHDSFPPHWDPPPRMGYDQQSPRLAEVLQILESQPAAKRVRTIYLEKLTRQIDDSYWVFYFLAAVGEEDFKTYITALERAPETHRIVARNADVFINLLKRTEGHDDTRATRIRSLLQVAGIRIPDEKDAEGGSAAGEIE